MHRNLREIVVTLAVVGLVAAAGCGKSKSKAKAKNDPAKTDTTATKPAGNQITCAQMVDHTYQIMKSFRAKDKSAYGDLAKHMDESPEAVKKRKAAQIRTCEQRKLTQRDLACYMSTKTLRDIDRCAKIWRGRQPKEAR